MSLFGGIFFREIKLFYNFEFGTPPTMQMLTFFILSSSLLFQGQNIFGTICRDFFCGANEQAKKIEARCVGFENKHQIYFLVTLNYLFCTHWMEMFIIA